MEELAALSPGFGTRAEQELLSLGRQRPCLMHRRDAFLSIVDRLVPVRQLP